MTGIARAFACPSYSRARGRGNSFWCRFSPTCFAHAHHYQLPVLPHYFSYFCFYCYRSIYTTVLVVAATTIDVATVFIYFFMVLLYLFFFFDAFICDFVFVNNYCKLTLYIQFICEENEVRGKTKPVVLESDCTGVEKWKNYFSITVCISFFFTINDDIRTRN